MPGKAGGSSSGQHSAPVDARAGARPPEENPYAKSFNGRLRDELLDREQFDSLLEAHELIEA